MPTKHQIENNFKRDGATILAKRLLPGDDLYLTMEKIVRDEHIQAGVILSLVGSLKIASIRFSGKENPEILTGPFEIVGATGTCCQTGLHIHLTLADENGRCLGGHLKAGSLVQTTVELVIIEAIGLQFSRENDPVTNYLELKINKRS